MINKQLQFIRSLYEKGENIMSFLRKEQNTNSIEAILISYDLQAGSYIKFAEKNLDFKKAYAQYIANLIAKFQPNSLLEVGVGEATTLANVLLEVDNPDLKAFGFDLSWSRIKYARKYINTVQPKQPVLLSTGDLFQMPYLDNSIDVVYTSHTLEPNGGKEKQALQELYRVTKKYLILFEPAYELANEKARKRMQRHGYVTNLYETAKSLEYDVLEYYLLASNMDMDAFEQTNDAINPTGVMIIKKSDENTNVTNPLACPITKASLTLKNNSYFSTESLLAYPIIDDIPCLIPDNAIVATKFLD